MDKVLPDRIKLSLLGPKADPAESFAYDYDYTVFENFVSRVST